MSQILEFTNEDGTSIFAEVEDLKPKGGDELVSKVGNWTRKTMQKSFEAAVAGTLRPVADAIYKNLSESENPPDEVAVSLGLKISAEFGNVLIAKTDGQAQLNITLKWKMNP